VTSVRIRYNTGLRISENGRQLSHLLDQLVAAWPVPVRAIALVGHSMGGLVGRSACHTGRMEGAGWVPLVRHLVSLGTPHLGSPVEKGVHLADHAMRRLPETQPLGAVVSRRSVGIKDLRFGAIAEEDWSGHDPDEFLRDRCTDVPLLDHATHYWVSASVIGGERHVLGRLVGDGLVRAPSAAGKGRSRSVPLAEEHGVHVESTSHFRLLNHPAVYDQLRGWLAGPSQ
jgi:pimeloyl-ACP methyl ester carboxylesterase